MRLLLQPASGLEGAVRVRRTLPWLLAAVTVDAMAATATLAAGDASLPDKLQPEMVVPCLILSFGRGCWTGKLSVLDMELEAFVASFKG